MNIKGLGESIIEELLERKLISNIADLYYLKADDISVLERMGEKSAENIITAIRAFKMHPARPFQLMRQRHRVTARRSQKVLTITKAATLFRVLPQ